MNISNKEFNQNFSNFINYFLNIILQKETNMGRQIKPPFIYIKFLIKSLKSQSKYLTIEMIDVFTILNYKTYF